MPRKAVEATDALVRNIKTVGVRAVGGVDGLCLKVSPRQSDIEARRAAVKEGRPVPVPAPHSADDPLPRSWVLRIPIHGKRQDIGLGSYPSVTLAAAREAARAIRAKVTAGVDPMAERREAKRAAAAAVASAVTFEKVAEEWWVKMMAPTRKGKSKPDQPIVDMRRLAFPVIGRVIVGDIRTAHILSVLEKDDLWTRINPTARNLQLYMAKVLDYAAVKELRSGDNPARWKGHLDQKLAAPAKVHEEEPRAALPYAQAPAFMAELRQAAGDGARALEVLMLTAARPGEVQDMTWDELDLDNAKWTIPAPRTKTKNADHVVPLSAPVLDLLRQRVRTEGVRMVFPGERDATKGLSNSTLNSTIKRMNKQRNKAGLPLWVDPKLSNAPVVPHGFRSTFRDWAAESGYPEALAELALGHVVGSKVQRAYNRSDRFEQRVPMMKAWADYCAGKA